MIREENNIIYNIQSRLYKAENLEKQAKQSD